MANTYLSRTPAVAGNRQIFTFSFWTKISNVTSRIATYNWGNSTGSPSSGDGNIFFNQGSDQSLVVSCGGGVDINVVTNQRFRDTSAWYHIVIAFDTTQATASNRVKVYINGIQVTSFSATSYPAQNYNLNVTNTSIQRLGTGYDGGITYYYDGSMASFYLIDGTALTPSSFGETDATTGIWKPKSYTGSFGTNGFFLKFENSGSLGTDSSGNGHNFTIGGGTPTQTIDTPSNVFATMNPLYQSVFGGSSAILTNGNTKWTGTSNGTSQNATLGTLGVNTGKWYWEVKGNMIYDCLLGIAKSNFDPNGGSGGLQNSGWWGLVTNVSATGGAGLKFVVDNTLGSSTGTTLSNGDIINIALDATNLKFYIGKNGTWLNSGVPTSGATGTGSIATLPTDTTFLPACSNYGYTTANSWEFNFGNGVFGTTAIASPYSDGAGLGKFQYAVPAGYYSLCTKNINSQG